MTKRAEEAMVRDWEDILLDAVREEWQALPAAFQPWGAWVRRYPKLPAGQTETDASTVPEAVWFLNERGIVSRNVWEWRRFCTVQFAQPWSSYKEPPAVWGEPTRIGLAAFAPWGEGGYYLETRWAGKYGHGWSVTIPQNGPPVRHELWIS